MNPIIPMWSLTGHPTTEQLRREMDGFLAGGVEQLMLYARCGFEYEYMGEEWRRICHDCITYAAAKGMRIWLYDEMAWPSGSCGGRVPRANPAFCAKRLARGDGKVVIEYADPDTERFAADILNPHAVDCFIAMTHEKYAAWFSEYFGNTVVGIFTDEPSLHYFSQNGKPAYYEGAFEDYKRLYGRDAKADYLGDEPDFYARWTDMLGNRFREVFLGRISAWCDAHGLKFTGHLMEDDFVCKSVCTSGNILSALEKFQIPGVDEIQSNPTDQYHSHYVLSLLSTMRARGKEGAMAELFAFGPESLPYIRRRQMIWYAAAHGVDHFFAAIAHLDARGNRVKRNYFCDFSPSTPHWLAGAPQLNKSAAEATEYAAKTPDVSVAIRFPYREALSNSSLYPKEGAVGRLVWEMTSRLDESQISWALIGEGDVTDTPFCFSFTNEQVIEETSGKHFESVSHAMTSLSEIARPVSVLSKDGSLADSVFVRPYTDGSYIVVDTRREPDIATRSLILRVRGKDMPIELPAAGVITDTSKQIEIENCISVENMRVRYDAPAVKRADFFGKEQYGFSLTEPMTLTFSRRIDGECEAVYLDGVLLDFPEKNAHLPRSMEALYETTKEISLAEGVHTLTTRAEDLPHLPAVLIFGNFGAYGNELSPRSDKWIDGAGFYRRAAVVFDADIPDGDRPLYLAYEDNRLASELYIDGELVGACAFAPYRYEIPAHLRGRVASFELRLYSSYAPLFGELEEIHRRIPLWKGDYLSHSVPEKLRLDHLRIGEVIAP